MRLFNIFFILALTVTSAAAQAAEAPRAPAAPAVPVAPIPDIRNAQETRQMLQHLFRQYPPSLSQVLRLDPSLLTNPAYLAPYPNLAAFLAQHSEIAHNPGFFVGDSNFYSDSRLDTPEARSYRMFEEVMAGVAVFVVMLTVVSVLCWIIKTVIDHRRWLRVSKNSE